MSEQHADRGFRKFWATMAELTPKQRWAHFWEYYKGVTMIVVLVAVVLGLTIYDLAKPRKEVIFKGAMVNVALTQKAEQALTEDLRIYLEGTEDQEAALMYFLIVTDPTKPHDPNSNYAEIMKLAAEITTGSIDYALMDEEAKDYYLQQEAFADLNGLLTPAQMAALKDRLVYQTLEEGKTIPVAIDLGDIPLDAGCSTEKGLFIAFPGNNDRKDKVSAVLDYLLQVQLG